MSQQQQSWRGSSGRSARAAHLYALLLRLYPAAHRRAFGQQMLRAFRDHYHDAVQTQGEPPLVFWLGVVGDASACLLHERSRC